jgi:hypothetical protein
MPLVAWDPQGDWEIKKVHFVDLTDAQMGDASYEWFDYILCGNRNVRYEHINYYLVSIDINNCRFVNSLIRNVAGRYCVCPICFRSLIRKYIENGTYVP